MPEEASSRHDFELLTPFLVIFLYAIWRGVCLRGNEHPLSSMLAAETLGASNAMSRPQAALTEPHHTTDEPFGFW